MRGSGCVEDWPNCTNPEQHAHIFHSIMEEKGHVALQACPNDAIDVMEIFGGKGGVTKCAIRRKLKTGIILDLIYGIDLSKAPERQRWKNYVRAYQPRVVVMGPPCIHFGAFLQHQSSSRWF